LLDCFWDKTKTNLIVWLLIQTLNNQWICKSTWCRKQWSQVDSQDWNTNANIGPWKPKWLKCKKHKIVEHIQELKIESGKQIWK